MTVKYCEFWQPYEITTATTGKNDESSKSAEDDSIEEESGEPISIDICHQSTNQNGLFDQPIRRLEPRQLDDDVGVVGFPGFGGRGFPWWPSQPMVEPTLHCGHQERSIIQERLMDN